MRRIFFESGALFLTMAVFSGLISAGAAVALSLWLLAILGLGWVMKDA
jgi:type IV secretory pathway TrbD component